MVQQQYLCLSQSQSLSLSLFPSPFPPPSPPPPPLSLTYTANAVSTHHMTMAVCLAMWVSQHADDCHQECHGTTAGFDSQQRLRLLCLSVYLSLCLSANLCMSTHRNDSICSFRKRDCRIRMVHVSAHLNARRHARHASTHATYALDANPMSNCLPSQQNHL